MRAIIPFFWLFFTVIGNISAQNNGKSLPDGSYYTCTMDPKVHNDAPGDCPICGMHLVKVKPPKPKQKRKPPPAPPKKAEVKPELPPSAPELLPDTVVLPTIAPPQIPPPPAIPAPPPPEPEPTIPEGPKTVRVDLFIGKTRVNFTGKKRYAMTVNGQLPAPTLTFTEGDTVEIYVHNLMREATSIHWHGLILPNRYDGVPYLTTPPIRSGETYLFKFPLVQNGTYWYHSHTGSQEQRGLYGAFIIHKKPDDPKRRAVDMLPELTVVLSDWTDENPAQVHRSLHNATDWYAIRKGSTQDYGSALRQGYGKTKLKNEWKRLLPMDVSDVAYNQFLSNGAVVTRKTQFKKGDQVRLRLVNGSSTTYFWLTWAGGKISVIANDGKDVEPVQVDRMLIAVSETYDVVLTIPADGSFELRATAEDRTRFTSVFLGQGADVTAPTLSRLRYFEGMKMMNGMMKMNGKMIDHGMAMSLQTMDMNAVMYPEVMGTMNMDMNAAEAQPSTTTLPDDFKTLNYSQLRSTENTALPADAPMRTMHWTLTGNMTRYVWTIDNKTVSESDRIWIKQGEKIRIILRNASMMRHPMHLHGHFFRVLNGQGDYAPLKNVLDIMPMETDTIEFLASEKEGNWFFHCHILYHMMSGMGRVFTYENSKPNPELPANALAKVYRDDRRFHSMAHITLASNGSDGEIMFGNTRWFAQTEWRLGLHARHGYESESHIGRFIGRNQFLAPYIGWDYRYRKLDVAQTGTEDTKDNRRVFCGGFRYMLPMFILFDARADHQGNLRVQVRRGDIALAPRLRLDLQWNTDKEWMVGSRWILTKYWSASAHYDSDMGVGVGVTATY